MKMIRIPAFIPHALTFWQSGCALALSLLFSLVLSTDALGASSILPSPTGDLHQAERILDRYSVQLEIDLNYQRIDKDDSLPNGYAARRFIGQTDQILIEVGIIHASGAGYELYVRTLAELPEGEEAKALQIFNQAVDAARANPSTPDTSDLAYEIYTLSYLQSDRAIALLKALGYTTIEYAQGQGESLFEKFYNPRQNGSWKLPVVIKLIDAAKTSLMDTAPNAQPFNQQMQQLNQRQAQSSAVPDIGGTYLHNTTAGEPQQRLLIAYDRNNPEPVSRLVSLLRDQVDRPARQIVIEALVIEVNTEKLSELGFDLTAAEGEFDAAFADGFDRALQPFTLTFTESEFPTSDYLQVRLSSLVARGDAEILSSPSVLVLDGRQARIQIGQQVPVVKSTATNAGIISAVDYFPVGIVLNLRPRINESGSEVTMQVETIVSSVSQTAGSGSSDVFVAPTIDNRQVQTFVRVADNTPFIIGGLISSDSRDIESRVPILSDIPIIGRAFKRKDQDQLKKEVIVVLTPHVIPLDEPDFNYLLPQDSDAFNSFGNLLFRSAYRVRADDVFDLGFIYDSEYFQNYRRTLQSELQRTVDIEARTALQQALRSVPGEEILVNRMIWEIVHETGFYNNVKTSNIILFNEDAAASDGSGFTTDFLGDHLPSAAQSALQIELDLAERGTAERPLVRPIASLYETSVSGDDAFTRTLIEANPDVRPGQKAMLTILISNGAQPKGVRGATSLDVLKGVLVMKKVIQLNSAMPRTLEAFREGRQLLFPSAEDLASSFHLIDFDTARLFFEVIQYYPEFEKQFKMTLRDNQITE